MPICKLSRSHYSSIQLHFSHLGAIECQSGSFLGTGCMNGCIDGCKHDWWMHALMVAAGAYGSCKLRYIS